MSQSKIPESNPEGYRREIIERLLAAWEKMPCARLAQLITNANHRTKYDLFYVEDYDFIELIEKHVDTFMA